MATNGRPSQRATPRLHILLVEDHALTARPMQKLLETRGFTVRTVGSHREALSMASQWLPDVLICDIGLPGKDGIEVMKSMRHAYPDLRGICVSGYTTPDDIARSHHAGFAEHLAKPICIDRLVSAIHRLFQK